MLGPDAESFGLDRGDHRAALPTQALNVSRVQAMEFRAGHPRRGKDARLDPVSDRVLVNREAPRALAHAQELGLIRPTHWHKYTNYCGLCGLVDTVQRRSVAPTMLAEPYVK